MKPPSRLESIYTYLYFVYLSIYIYLSIYLSIDLSIHLGTSQSRQVVSGWPSINSNHDFSPSTIYLSFHLSLTIDPSIYIYLYILVLGPQSLRVVSGWLPLPESGELLLDDLSIYLSPYLSISIYLSIYLSLHTSWFGLP